MIVPGHSGLGLGSGSISIKDRLSKHLHLNLNIEGIKGAQKMSASFIAASSSRTQGEVHSTHTTP